MEKFSPSHLKSLEICPGFRPKEFEENQWTKEGKLLHKCLECPDDKGLREQLTQEQLDQLSVVEAYTAPLLVPNTCLHSWKEYKFLLSELFDIINIRNGIADLVIQRREYEFEVVDYKFGRKQVEQEDNIQLAVYAAATFLEFPKARRVKVTILQPRLGLEGTTSQVYEFGTDFTGIMDRIKEIIKKALDPLSLLVADTDNCKFCQKYFTCSQVNTLISKSSGPLMEVLPISREDIANMLTDVVSAEKCLQFATFCEHWAKETKTRITEKAKANQLELPHYKNINVKGRKQIRDQGACLNFLRQAAGDVVLECVKVDLSQCNKFLTQKVIDQMVEMNLIENGPGYSYLKALK